MYVRIAWLPSEPPDFRYAKRQTEIGRKLISDMIQKQYGKKEFSFTYNENGKPLTDVCFFNISHSDRLIICALSDRPIGVDAEKIDFVKKRERYLLFTDRETRYVNAHENFKERFYFLWTRKEAYIKALGGKLADAAHAELVGKDLKPLAQINGFVFQTHRFQGYMISLCKKEK